MRIQEWLGEDNQLGMDIWSKKYQQNGETFDEWLDRVSGNNAMVRCLIAERKFLFGGRILSNRGLDKQGRKVTYSNCYVIAPPEDNIESIFNTASKLARTFSYGGGCGIDISKLAPRGAKINNTARETTGSVSFMDLYNLITDLIGQNGRRGALMLSIDCNHPDLEEFISVKNDLSSINKANISVRIDDNFMQAVLANDPYYELTFKREETGEIITKVVNPMVIFEQLCKNNWDFAEPGLLFWDRIKSHNLLANDETFSYAGVNPCAEEPLPAGGSCLLGSINLSEFVKDGEFRFREFQYAVEVAVLALNEVLDEGLPLHPLQEQRESVADWRQIGLGIFGLADMLIKLGLSYGSNDSIELCDKIGFLMIDTAIKQSAKMAEYNGAYPKFRPEILDDNLFFLNNTTEETKKLVYTHGLRNSQLLTIAPTGSISTMLGVSGGIEPIFDTHYVRKTESLHGEDKYYTVYTPIVEQYMIEHGIEDVNDIPSYFATAKTITPMRRINMQACWQEYIDASISSTINLKESVQPEDVVRLYKNAWQKGLKGLTIFRENCARLGILSSVTEEKDEIPEEVLQRGEWKSLAEDTYYVKRSIVIGCGKLKLFIGYSPSEQSIQDLYIVKSGQGGCEKNLQALAISMSALLRVGGNLEQLEKAFSGITPCPSFISVKAKGIQLSRGNYCGSAIINEVKSFLKDVNGVEQPKHYQVTPEKVTPEEVIVDDKVICPECGEKMSNQVGCNICLNCGYSKCD